MASPGGGSGKADAVGDLSGKSLEELLEILQRQEKLLSNKNFIARLPDRGEKILDYTKKVQAAIAQHKRLRETTGLLSAFKLQFERHNTATERGQVPAVLVDKKTLASSAQIQQKKSSGSTAYLSKMKNTPNLEASNHLLPMAAASEVAHESSLGTKRLPVLVDSSLGAENLSNALPVNTVSQMGNKPNVGANRSPLLKDNQETRDAAALADDLVDGLTMISIKDSRGDSSESSETSLQDKVTLNPLAKKSHFVEVVERRAQNPEHRKEKFRTNRLPSDSNSSTPNQSPGERALRLSAEERRAQDRKHLDDITAATLPPLHHSPAQLLPLEESLTLQIAQNKSYEEKQAKLAAQKLFEKLNIKMGPFNPEGDSYMKYRDQNDDEGYGAEE